MQNSAISRNICVILIFFRKIGLHEYLRNAHIRLIRFFFGPFGFGLDGFYCSNQCKYYPMFSYTLHGFRAM